MKLSDYVAEWLSKNVKHVFCGNGGVVIHLLDSIAKRKDIELIPTQHEQSAAIAAEAYARIHGFGCAIATSGPGFINLLQGIACAYYDSIPVLYIVGGCPTNHQKSKVNPARQQGFQEMDVIGMTLHITKASHRLRKEDNIEDVLNLLRHYAISNRPGPVLLEIPDDLQRIDFIGGRKINVSLPNCFEFDYKIKEFMNLLRQSKRPIVIVGGGVKIGKAEKEMDEFLQKSNILYVCTWVTKDIVSRFTNNCIGTFGINGTVVANKIIQESDLVISFGCKLDTHQTGGNPSSFAPNAKKIMIDIDYAEMIKQNQLVIDLKINADVKQFLNLANKEHNYHNQSQWQQRVYDIKDKNILSARYIDTENVNPYVFMEYLAKYADDDAIIITDAGATLTWTMQAFQPRANQELFSAFNHSPMGYSLPAAIGAYYATDGKRQIICIIGDGGLAMCSHELETIRYRDIPIKIFVIDNQGYGIMRQTQDTWLDGKHTAVDEDSGLGFVNLFEIWRAYFKDVCCSYWNIDFNNDFDEIQNALNDDNECPSFCSVRVSPDMIITPKLKFGKSIGDIE